MEFHLHILKWRFHALVLAITLIGSLASYAQQFDWAIPFGGGMINSRAEAHTASVADNQQVFTDRDGNAYVVGVFDGIQDFDPGTGSAVITPILSDKLNVFLAKYSADGTHLWSRCVAANKSISATWQRLTISGVTVDNMGEVVIIGSFDGTLYFNTNAGIDSMVGPTPTGFFGVASTESIYLFKYSNAGDFLWGKEAVRPYTDIGHVTKFCNITCGGLCTDQFGNIYASGRFTGGFDFDPGPGQYDIRARSRVDHGYVAKYTASGDLVWAKGIGLDSDSTLDFKVIVQGVAVDTQQGLNDVIITGNFYGNVDFDPSTGQSVLSSMGRADVFLQKLDSNGAFQWIRHMGGSGLEEAEGGVAISRLGNIYISGRMNSDDADFDPGANVATLHHNNVSPPLFDFYIAKYDNDGNYLWAKSIGDTGANSTQNGNGGHCFIIDDYENLYISGGFLDGGMGLGSLFPGGGEGVDFDPTNSNMLLFDSLVPPRPVRKLNFVAQYDACGNYKWAGKFPGAEGTLFDFGISMYHAAVDTVAIYIKGIKAKSLDLGPMYLFTDFDPGPDTFQFQLQSWPDDYLNFLVKLNFALPVSTLNVSICDDGYTLGDSTYTESGTYVCPVGLPESCDSVVVLTLELTPPIQQPVITVDERILGVTLSYSTYQWYLNGQVIAGATDSVYSVLQNGDYTVVVTNEAGCADTSEIYTVTNVGIGDPNRPAPLLVYPNPVEDQIYIESQTPVTIIITDVAGPRIKSVEAAKRLWVADLTPGVYLVELRNSAGQLIQVNRVVKM